MRGGTTRFLHSGLKNVDAQTTTSQTLGGTRRYDAFGNVDASTGTWSGPFGYGGGFGYQEEVTVPKLLGHRLYDSSTGRFITRDPIKDGRNWYVYCDSDPIRKQDPNGFDPMSDYFNGWARWWENLWPHPSPPAIIPGHTKDVAPVNTFEDASPFPGNACTPGPDTIWLPPGTSTEEFLSDPIWVNHEIGHAEQARKIGPLYLAHIVGAMVDAGYHGGDWHDDSPMEREADQRAYELGPDIFGPRW